MTIREIAFAAIVAIGIFAVMDVLLGFPSAVFAAILLLIVLTVRFIRRPRDGRD
jgi:hypothetical protein